MVFWCAVHPVPDWKIHIAATGSGLCRLAMRMEEPAFLEMLGKYFPENTIKHDPLHPVLHRTSEQLERYLAGKLRDFELPLDMRGTAFQKRCWDALLTIPYGETRSYARMARQIGAANAFRAVGAANGQNPVAIVVPCHRVIASDGSLCGFGGGLDLKRKLLDLEGQQRLDFSAQFSGSSQ